jgi:hypothetical protein
MSRKVRATALGALLVTLIGVWVVSAGSQAPPTRTTLTFFDPRKTNFEKEIDEGRQGFSPGDWGLFIENLKDPDTCDPAGKIIGRFTVSKFIGEENAFFLLDFGFRLPDGTITGYHAGKFFDFESATRNHLAVTGGTQTYKDATGEFSLESGLEMCGTRGDLITVDLLLS